MGSSGETIARCSESRAAERKAKGMKEKEQAVRA
jgi:hypothetical protein